MAELEKNLGRSAPTFGMEGQEDLLASIHKINLEFLQIISNERFSQSYPGRQHLRPLTPIMSGLDTDMIAKAARFPFLLVDLHFSEPAWWSADAHAHADAVHDLPDLPHSLRNKLIPFVRSVITLAWHVAKTEREAALLLLGLAPGVSSLVSRKPVQDLDLMTELGCRSIRPRWCDSPSIWRQLLSRSEAMPVDAARAFVFHALQMAASDQLMDERPRARPITLR